MTKHIKFSTAKIVQYIYNQNAFMIRNIYAGLSSFSNATQAARMFVWQRYSSCPNFTLEMCLCYKSNWDFKEIRFCCYRWVHTVSSTFAKSEVFFLQILPLIVQFFIRDFKSRTMYVLAYVNRLSYAHVNWAKTGCQHLGLWPKTHLSAYLCMASWWGEEYQCE